MIVEEVGVSAPTFRKNYEEEEAYDNFFFLFLINELLFLKNPYEEQRHHFV
jgi:hypothetical protein